MELRHEGKEYWRSIAESPEYLVSSYGRVYSTRTGNNTALIPDNGHGYPVTNIRIRKGTTRIRLIHRLMGIAFIPNPENKPQVAHLDGDRSNYALWNLAWATQKENESHKVVHGTTKRIHTVEEIMDMYNMYIRKFSTDNICKKYSIDRGNLKKILNKEHYTEILFPKVDLERKDLITKEEQEEICKMRKDGMFVKDIIKHTGRGKTSLYRIFRRNNLTSKER